MFAFIDNIQYNMFLQLQPFHWLVGVLGTFVLPMVQNGSHGEEVRIRFVILTSNRPSLETLDLMILYLVSCI